MERNHSAGINAVFHFALGIPAPDGNTFVFGVHTEHRNGTDAQALPGRLQHVAFASDEPEKLLSFYTNTGIFARRPR